MSTATPSAGPRNVIEGPDRWPWLVGLVRLGMLGVVATGTYLIADRRTPGIAWLPWFFALGGAASVYYLVSLRRERAARRLLTQAQVLLDFGVVAATVSFTGGGFSFFTFLFVIVILESGLLLGQAQGFLYATLATGFMLIQAITTPPDTGLPSGSLTLWYSFFIEVLAFYLTASISGYWSLRLYRMQQFQREILDNMNNGFLITDNEGTVTAINNSALDILGIPPGQAQGRPVGEILRVESGAECPIITALRSRRDFTSYEFYARAADDQVRLLGLTTSAICDAQKRLSGLIASFSDLTEMAQMREELKRQDRLAVVGELAAGLAHEIRNPVAAIRGAVDELRHNIEAPALVEKLASIAIRESDHLNRIVSDFLDFARRPSMRREVFDVCGLIEEVADALRAKHRGNELLAIETRQTAAPCAVSGDRSQIKQVFVNVAKNGIEAMGERGVLAIVASSGPGWIEVRFEDDGPGIPPDEIARIFEPFYTTKETGVGMGLAVCMRIVTAHDGTMRVTPREGGGAAMCVRLPSARREE